MPEAKKRRTGGKQENDVEDAKGAALAVASDVTASAIAASYNDQIRPLLDAVDRLRHLKSSVLEFLAGISLSRGQGIFTRVPLLEYSSRRVVATTEAKVADAINTAMAEIAGSGKGISDAPITLVVRKRGVPDLTLVDLPGITRVPVQGQPEDIYHQVAKIIKDYIAPKESIILNVLSATVDFPKCESIRMSQQVDRTGERTLAVVTKVDKAPEGLLEKVTMDDVHIGLGYVCVRNRIGDETYDQARVEEERLFKYHPLLSKIDKSMVGIPVLAQRLMQIQATIIARCLPDIVKQINDRLIRSRTELDQMPPDLNNTRDAVRVFFHIVKKVCTSLEKILVRAEFDEYPDDCYFHGTARIAGMLNRYAKKLPTECPKRSDELFLMEEIHVLEETMGISLPNFLPRSAFHVMLKKKVEMVGQMPQDLVNDVWEYVVEDLVMKILLQHSENFPQVQPPCRLAIQSLMEKARARSAQHVKELIEIGAAVMEGQKKFMESVENNSKPTKITLEGFGDVDVCHLRSIVLRFVDGLALHVVRGVKRLVENDLEEELADQLLGNNMAGVERMLSPLPSTGTKRDRLKKSIVLLQQSKEVVANILDRISAADEV
ncbi:hypothetical protein PVAP13_9KG515500 [Panicum virgatum]|uniref:Dynamin-related protein 4C n=1 Tax=Panicum virgatum TaxID=38727 RepID=A0A8T0NXT7_PANVG|nr:hypothetical protein PVAP13_9KG515500 [Panicum virgatum]